MRGLRLITKENALGRSLIIRKTNGFLSWVHFSLMKPTINVHVSLVGCLFRSRPAVYDNIEASLGK